MMTLLTIEFNLSNFKSLTVGQIKTNICCIYVDLEYKIKFKIWI